MTGGGGYETPYPEFISSPLEGSGGEVTVPCSLSHRVTVRNALDLFHSAVSTLHIEHGGWFYIGCLIGFSLFVKFIQLSIYDRTEEFFLLSYSLQTGIIDNSSHHRFGIARECELHIHPATSSAALPGC